MSEQRIHAMDHLRAHMMLLGILFHAAMPFCITEAPPIDSYLAESGHKAFNSILTIVHFFRMPVFFIIAGYFTCLLVSRRGANAMLKDRAQRIVIPFILFWPLTIVINRLAIIYHSQAEPLEPLSYSYIFSEPHLFHLWFLYMLVFFYLLILLFERLINVQTQTQLAQYFWRKPVVILLGLLVAPAYWFGENYHIPAPLDLVPDVPLYGYYFGFFVAGYLMYRSQHSLEFICKHNKLWFFAALIFLLLHVATGFIALSAEAAQSLTTNWYSGSFKAMSVSAFSIWVISCYLRWANVFSKTMRYISESSYWLYLIHFPLALWLPILMHDSGIPIGIRYLITLAAVMIIGLLSYRYLVQPSWLGALLNGKLNSTKATGATELKEQQAT